MFGMNKHMLFCVCKDFMVQNLFEFRPEVVEDTEKTLKLKIVRRKRVITVTLKLLSGKIQLDVDDTDYLIHIPTKTFKKDTEAQLHILNIKKAISDNLR